MILGHISGRPSKFRALKGLFSPQRSDRRAVRAFLRACQRQPPQALVTLRNHVHTLICGPSGSGKGVSFAVPHLLYNNESAVVLDLGGELAKVTAHRRKQMGHRVVLLDPYKLVTSSPDTLNPLDFISADSPLAIDDCNDLAEALVVRTGQEKEPHWNIASEVWIAAMAMGVCRFANPPNRSLQSVRTFLTDPDKMQAAIKLMCESDAWGGLLSRIGNKLKHYQSKELNSVLTTTNGHLRFLDSAAVYDSTLESSFDPYALRDGKMTVYLITPADRFRAQIGLSRMWLGAMFRACVKGGSEGSDRVHFLIDEAGALGRMEVVNDAIDKYRKYSVRLMLFYQSIGQLKSCYPEDQGQTVLSNTTQIFFAVNEFATAEYVTNMLGDQTIRIASGGTSQSSSSQTSQTGGSTSQSSSISHNWNQGARKLLTAAEVINLPQDVAITLTPGMRPIMTRMIKYYNFNPPNPMAIWRMVIDTFCLLLTAAFFAYLATMILLQQMR